MTTRSKWRRITKMASGKRKNCRLYRIWMGMHARCYRETDTSYPYYGAKGVAVCAEWKDYAIFRAWAVANGYGPRMTIERDDHEQDYSPETCRWIDVSEQQFNTRASIRITYKGSTKSLPEWARQVGISVNTLRSRVYNGWLPHEIIETPLEQRRVTG